MLPCSCCASLLPLVNLCGCALNSWHSTQSLALSVLSETLVLNFAGSREEWRLPWMFCREQHLWYMLMMRNVSSLPCWIQLLYVCTVDQPRGWFEPAWNFTESKMCRKLSSGSCRGVENPSEVVFLRCKPNTLHLNWSVGSRESLLSF